MIDQQAVEPGQIIHNRYKIDVALATGGQAHVYRGRQIELDRDVAIKLLKNHGTPEIKQRTTRRFEQEAKLISKLRDPHTITLYDFGKLESGALFMVFEYINGISLKELVAEQGPIAPYRVAKILKQTLSSLHEAHSMGVLHRDLKPANIMVFEHAGRKDQVKLLDFGIAKIMHADGPFQNHNLTGDRVIGTPRYIAPELLLREQATAASDLYSLGMVGYELLVGRPAIKARASLEIVAKQIDAESFELPSHLDIPPRLSQIINKLIRKKPHERYQDVLDVSLDLKRWIRQSHPQIDSEAFDDLTPSDDIESMREFRAHAAHKEELRVIVDQDMFSDPTPRTAFSQSVVFEGKPSAPHVETLIHKSMKMEHAVVSPEQLSGSSATAHTHASQSFEHTEQIYISKTLQQASQQAAIAQEGRRGGDTLAIESPFAPQHDAQGMDRQKIAVIAIIVGLLALITVIIGLIVLLLNS